jgi:plastocyanin
MRSDVMVRVSRVGHTFAFLVVVLVGALHGHVRDMPDSASVKMPTSRRHVIEIRGFEFQPAAVHVAAGDTVVWWNRDVVPHTATASDSVWNTGNIAAGGTVSLVVRAIVEQSYFCVYHPSMKGKLIHR